LFLMEKVRWMMENVIYIIHLPFYIFT